MKKKGFTLVELLAVIVILAIIAVIATPIILNVIEKAKKGAAENSALGYLDAFEKQIVINEMNEITISDGVYSIDGNFLNNNKINYKGAKPTNGSIQINNKNIIYAELCIDELSIQYSQSKAKIVDEDYCNKTYLDESLVYNFNYTGNEQEFIAPKTGTYKIETWGAQGGSYNATGGYGGYSQGVVELEKNTKLYINVGGAGSYTGTIGGAGYNGGGNSSLSVSAGGGGATHIAMTSGLLSTLETKQTSILIVSGGGGGTGCDGNADGTDCADGGSGGGTEGVTNKKVVAGCLSYNEACYGSGGTQTAGGIGGVYSINGVSATSGSFGQGGAGKTNPDPYGNGGGGGGGYYGGGGAAYNAAGGGSGYIGNTLLTNKVMYCYNCLESSDIASKTVSTTNVSETATSEYAKIGNGYAKITFLSE